MKLITACLGLCAFLLLCGPETRAQGNEASVVGKVTEGQAGPIVGATVFVKNESTGFSTGTVTDADGNYIIKQLPLGSP